MGVMISVVRSSNPDGLRAAAEAIREKVSTLDDLIGSQRRSLHYLGQAWSGAAVRIQYEAANGFAPPGAELSGHVVRGDIVVTPGKGSAAASVDGLIGDYPSLEAYQNVPTGHTYTLAQDAADSGNVYGPLTELPLSHEIGRGTAAFAPFGSDAPQLPGGPRYPGDTVPYIPGRVDLNAPTDLGSVERIPDVVVVK